jgi:type III secretory pathway component EscT
MASPAERTLNGIIADGLLLARPIAMLTFTPVFTRVEFTALLRGAVASALVLPMVPTVLAALQREGWSALGQASRPTRCSGGVAR